MVPGVREVAAFGDQARGPLAKSSLPGPGLIWSHLEGGTAPPWGGAQGAYAPWVKTGGRLPQTPSGSHGTLACELRL